MLTGTMKTSTTETPVSGKMLGTEINLTAANTTYTGQVSGSNLTLKSGSNEIRATKLSVTFQQDGQIQTRPQPGVFR